MRGALSLVPADILPPALGPRTKLIVRLRRAESGYAHAGFILGRATARYVDSAVSLSRHLCLLSEFTAAVHGQTFTIRGWAAGFDTENPGQRATGKFTIQVACYPSPDQPVSNVAFTAAKVPLGSIGVKA